MRYWSKAKQSKHEIWMERDNLYVKKKKILTRISLRSTYELKRNAFSHKLVKTIEQGGTQIVEVQNIFLHQDHCPSHSISLVHVVRFEGIHQIAKHGLLLTCFFSKDTIKKRGTNLMHKALLLCIYRLL